MFIFLLYIWREAETTARLGKLFEGIEPLENPDQYKDTNIIEFPTFEERAFEFRFNPTDDITAPELAIIIAELPLTANKQFLSNAPPSVKRHFK